MRLNCEQLEARETPSDLDPVGGDRTNLVESSVVVAADGPRPIGPDGLPFAAPAEPDRWPTTASVLLAVQVAAAASTVLPK